MSRGVSLCMGVTLPPALAGSDNEVKANSDGARKTGRLIGGVTLMLGIGAAGSWLFKQITDATGTGQNAVSGFMEGVQ